MTAAVISYHLDLVIRLIDTTTGRAVTESNVRFFENDKPIALQSKHDGTYLGINLEKEDFSFRACVYGYEECEVLIQFETLDSQMPIRDVFLIPKENTTSGDSILSLRGVLPGIQAIEAVDLNVTQCCIREFDSRKRIMTLFNPHNLQMKNVYYGLINREKREYEAFEVVKNISDSQVKISQPLENEFAVNFPISRRVFGNVLPDGNFILRVRESSEQVLYLVKYVVNQSTRFQVVDFHDAESMKLN